MFTYIPGFRVQFAEDISVLRIQWDISRHNLQGFREGMTAIAQLIKQKSIRLVLTDMNDLPSLGIEEQFWIGTSWLPQLSACRIQHVALVLPANNMYNQMVAEGLIRAGRHFINYDIQFFADAAEGLDWLLQNQVSLVELLDDEWKAEHSVPRTVPESLAVHVAPVGASR